VGVGEGATVAGMVEDGDVLSVGVGVGVTVGSGVGEVEGINSGVLVGAKVGVGDDKVVFMGIIILSPSIQPNPIVLATKKIIIRATFA
jgi:hypothetical protein